MTKLILAKITKYYLLLVALCHLCRLLPCLIVLDFSKNTLKLTTALICVRKAPLIIAMKCFQQVKKNFNDLFNDYNRELSNLSNTEACEIISAIFD